MSEQEQPKEAKTEEHEEEKSDSESSEKKALALREKKENKKALAEGGAYAFAELVVTAGGPRADKYLAIRDKELDIRKDELTLRVNQVSSEKDIAQINATAKTDVARINAASRDHRADAKTEVARLSAASRDHKTTANKEARALEVTSAKEIRIHETTLISKDRNSTRVFIGFIFSVITGAVVVIVLKSPDIATKLIEIVALVAATTGGGIGIGVLGSRPMRRALPADTVLRLPHPQAKDDNDEES